MSDEPQAVQDARKVICDWELRDGHHVYVEPLHGGWHGFQARCWDCDWQSAERLRGAEPIDSDEGRSHKKQAWRDAQTHREATRTSCRTYTEDGGYVVITPRSALP